MILSLLNLWSTNCMWGFAVLEVDTFREDETNRALIGVSYVKDEKQLYIDLFWRMFIFNLNPRLS
jgi:hypothetical protein